VEQPAARRRSPLMVRTGMIILALGLAIAMWVRHRPPRMIVVPVAALSPPCAPTAPTPIEPTPPTPPPPPPPPPPVEPDPLAACPATFTVGTTGALHAPRGIHSITPSHHDVRLLAAWSDDTLHVSVDEGLSFRRVLDHPGSIGDAAFDCRGRLHAIRGDGELGTYDPRDKTERWTRVATFWSRRAEVDKGRLILDGADVAVIGNTPARRDRLWLFHRGEDDRWQPKHLFSNREPGYWSGIRVGSIRTLPGDRLRMMVTPNMDDYGVAECWYSKLYEVTFDPRGRRIAARDLGEGGEPSDDRLQQDAAGRWLLVVNGRASRLSTEELVARLGRRP
jgi:hypothetical protein